jgi:ABC-type glycerol-3-phosphate transport system substrate-binding protein
MGALMALVSACAAGGPSAGRPQPQTIEVMGAWAGAEQQNFERVIQAFQKKTGVRVTYTSASPSVPAALQTRIAGGVPPDVAFLPQPGTLRQYASAGLLVPLDQATRRIVAASYNQVWQQLASYGGREYGVWFKAADKSLVWYNIGAFEKAGVVPSDNITGLLRIAHTLQSAGIAPFAVGGANPWTLSDWFANLYLQVAGPQRYDLLAEHQIPWTDPSVKETLRLMTEVLAPDFLAGGPQGTLHTTFPQSVTEVLSVHPLAAMTSEAEFVLGAVPAKSQARPGIDFDAFPFPAVGTSGPGVVVGGDVAVMMRQSTAAADFLRYLATPGAAALWASQGGFISPNLNLDLAVYPDDIIRGAARSLLEAGNSLRFGLGDLQPPSFGATASAGLEKDLADLLVTGDVNGTASALERAAAAAYRQ